MEYNQRPAHWELSNYVKSFWMVDRKEKIPVVTEKIVPDGYPEIIFHYGDPYEINISGTWELQSKDLVAGQISKFFHLRNTGRIGMFAIKFQPWVLHHLFDLDMEKLTDQVVSIENNLADQLAPVKSIAVSPLPFEAKIAEVETWLRNKIRDVDSFSPPSVQLAIENIIVNKGHADSLI